MPTSFVHVTHALIDPCNEVKKYENVACQIRGKSQVVYVLLERWFDIHLPLLNLDSRSVMKFLIQFATKCLSIMKKRKQSGT